MAGFLSEFADARTGCSIVIEDDGRVAYAYMLDSEAGIVADIWLYNRWAAPEEPEWDHRPTTPILNPKEYVRTDLEFELPDSGAEFTVDWQLQGPSDPKAIIYLRNEKWAMLTPGSKPGCCCLASKDGPLARILPTPV
jgi:hypothetical protein